MGPSMARMLKTKVGAAIYARQKCIVEPAFGQIKQARGFRQFLLRGVEKVQGKWALICMTHKVLKFQKICYELSEEERLKEAGEQKKCSPSMPMIGAVPSLAHAHCTG